jgi:hypothetical protein
VRVYEVQFFEFLKLLSVYLIEITLAILQDIIFLFEESKQDIVVSLFMVG